MTEQELIKYIDKWKPLIYRISSNKTNTISDFEDLNNEGVLGIIKAVRNYDESRGDLDSFVCRCLHNAIISAAAESSFAVHIPSGSMAIIDDPSKYKSHPLSEDIEDHKNIFDNYELDLEEIIDKFDRDGIARMYLIDGLTYAQIAKRKNVSISYISRLINKVKRSIKEKVLTE